MELASLLEEAKIASPGRRIEWRDRIAAFGTRGIEGVEPWLSSPVLAAFAIRVIERIGANGEATLAMRVLRAARATVPQAIRADVDWALQRLRLAARRPEPSDPDPTVASPVTPIRREQARRSTVARRRAR